MSIIHYDPFSLLLDDEPQPRGRSAPNLVGQSFGRWAVVRRVDNSAGGAVRWLCRCSCGTQRIVLGASLRSGISQSCGCLHREICSNNTSRGMANSVEYRAWAAMKSRCLNSNHAQWRYYGELGIQVCAGFQTSFEAFYEALGQRPGKGYSVDRLDPGGHYSCGQCQQCHSQGWSMNLRWATASKQRSNQRRSCFVWEDGRYISLAEYASQQAESYRTLYQRLKRAGRLVRRADIDP